MNKILIALSLIITTFTLAAQDLSKDDKGLPAGAAIGDYSEVNYTAMRVYHHMENMIHHLEEVPLNTWLHTDIADHSFFVITPALDHLYTKALVDLRNGPVVIETTERDNRYASLHIFDSEHYTKYAETTPKTGGKYLIVRDGYTGEIPKDDFNDVITVGDDFSFVFIRTQTFNFTHEGKADEIRRQNKITPMVAAAPIELPKRDDPQAVLNWTIKHSDGYQETSGYMAAAAATYTLDKHQAVRQHLSSFLTTGEVKGNPGIFEAHDDKDGGSNKLRAAGTLIGHLGFPVYHAYYENVNADRDGSPLNGSKDFVVTIPHDHGLNEFWSITRYNAKTFLPLDPKRIGGETTQVFNAFNTEPDTNGNITITFSVTKPKDGTYWMPTVDNEGYYMIFRYYGANEKLNGKTAFDIIYSDSPLAGKFQSVKFEQ